MEERCCECNKVLTSEDGYVCCECRQPLCYTCWQYGGGVCIECDEE